MFSFLNKSDEELLDICEVRTARGSGPGGTKADTTEHAVRIHHEESGISAIGRETRSQAKNRKRALRRLRRTYAREVRHDIDPDQLGIPPVLEEYVEQDLRMNPSNDHYPFLVKLVLDILNTYEGSVGDTSEFFGVSTGRLVKFLKRDDKLWAAANRIREQHDLHRLE